MKNKILFGLFGAIFIVVSLFIASLFIKHEVKITTSGIISAQEVEIASQVSGTVEKVFINEGETVSKGELIAKIDDTETSLRLRNAQAQLSKARNRLRLIRSGARPQEKRMAQAEMSALKAKRDQSAKQYSRIRTLYHYGDVEKNQLDLARTEYIISQENYQGALAKYSLVRAGSRIEEINIARAEVAQAQAQVQLLAKGVEDSLIKATIPGIINKTIFNPGELITVGATMASLINLDDVWVNIYVPEKEICLVKLGQRAEIKVDSYPGLLFPGIVSHIDNKAEFLPKNVQTKEDRVEQVFRVKVALTNRDHLLKAGIPADVDIILNKEDYLNKPKKQSAIATTRHKLTGDGYLYKNKISKQKTKPMRICNNNDSMLFTKKINAVKSNIYNGSALLIQKNKNIVLSQYIKRNNRLFALSSLIEPCAFGGEAMLFRKEKEIFSRTTKYSYSHAGEAYLFRKEKKVITKKISNSPYKPRAFKVSKKSLSLKGKAELFKKKITKVKIATKPQITENKTSITIDQIGLPQNRMLSMEVNPKEENIKNVTAVFNKKYHIPLNKIGNNLWHCNYILPRKAAALPYPIKFIMKNYNGELFISKRYFKVEKIR